MSDKYESIREAYDVVSNKSFNLLREEEQDFLLLLHNKIASTVYAEGEQIRETECEDCHIYDEGFCAGKAEQMRKEGEE